MKTLCVAHTQPQVKNGSFLLLKDGDGNGIRVDSSGHFFFSLLMLFSLFIYLFIFPLFSLSFF